MKRAGIRPSFVAALLSILCLEAVESSYADINYGAQFISLLSAQMISHFRSRDFADGCAER